MKKPITHAVAHGLASLGRNGDSKLVHMTPGELNGLHNLAAATGNKLTINPHTGLPEASILGALLPTLFGFAADIMTAGASVPLQMAAGAGAGALGGALGGAKGKGILMDALAGGASAGLAGGLQSAGAATGANTLSEITSPNLSSVTSYTPFTSADLSFGTPTQNLMAGLSSPASIKSAVGAAGPLTSLMAVSPFINEALKPPQTHGPTNPTMYISGGSYTPGKVNPNFGQPGQAYFLGQGYTPGTLSKSYTYNPNIAVNPDGTPATYTPPAYGAKEGGTVGMASGGGTSSSSSAPTNMNIHTPSADAMDAYLANLNQLAPATFQMAPQPTTPAPTTTTSGSSPTTTPSPIPGLPMSVYNSLISNRGAGGASGAAALLNSIMSRAQLAGGGPVPHASGGISSLGSYSDGGRLLKGPGDGMSDSIPAQIHGVKPQPAALADGEFVVPADVVSHLGNGSTDAGARKLYSMMDRIRHARTGKKKQAPEVKTDTYLPA